METQEKPHETSKMPKNTQDNKRSQKCKDCKKTQTPKTRIDTATYREAKNRGKP